MVCGHTDCGHTDLDYRVTLVNIYGTERVRVEVGASFCYSIEPLNLSNFIINQIADFNILQLLGI